MPFVKKLNLKGPKGDPGPSTLPSTTAVFMAANPVGTIMERDDTTDPSNWGGTWTRLPDAIGRGALWKRTA